MIQKRRFGLSTQINIIFTAITVITSLMFVFIFNQTIINYTETQAINHHRSYHDSARNMALDPTIENVRFPSTSYYLTVLVIKDINAKEFSYFRNDTFPLESQLVHKMIDNFDPSFFEMRYDDIAESTDNDEFIPVEEGYSYLVTYIYEDSDSKQLLLTVSNGTYGSDFKKPISTIITIGFVSIIVLGNAINLLWTSIVVQRIKKLRDDVSYLSSNNYVERIEADGKDEITDLTLAIEEMRQEIYQNERVKSEMLQNISHDIKTPIAVIRSYAEAIQDGITDINEVSVIIRQSEILNRKVKQLLEWNKLEYIKDESDYKDVNMKVLINNVANNHKYHSEIEFILDLEDTIYRGIEDNYYSMINNIVENSLRYAKSVIKITLKNKRITIFNDGEPISDEFLTGTFKPYEKGHKGQFGLGMVIVQRTVKSFNLNLIITNLNNGVEFIIEPRV